MTSTSKQKQKPYLAPSLNSIQINPAILAIENRATLVRDPSKLCIDPPNENQLLFGCLLTLRKKTQVY